MKAAAPGSYQPSHDRWGSFPALSAEADLGATWIVDAKVARLHPSVLQAISKRQPRAVLKVRASESLKSWASLGKLCTELSTVVRGSLLVAVGGGTVGDVSAVAAHLARRGLRLWQVPTTLLAAADSSLGGKGAVNAAGVKNAIGVFHYPERGLICPELFETLPESRWREGALEALKLELCLAGSPRWSPDWRRELGWVRRARELKARCCAKDPYEQTGHRALLNFGHTFGHVIESVSQFKVPHGEAVGLGMLAALDVGLTLGITPPSVRDTAEQLLEQVQGPDARRRLALWLEKVPVKKLEALLNADKKSSSKGLRMVLLDELGHSELVPVGDAWRGALP